MEKVKDKKGKKRGSLTIKSSIVVVFVAVLFAVVSLLLSTSLYERGITTKLAIENCLIGESIDKVISQRTDVTLYAERIKLIYDNIPEDVKKDPYSEEYRAYFDDIENENDYKFIVNTLKGFRDSGVVSEIYIMTYDYETGNGIYIADPDESETKCYIGEYEMVYDYNFNGYYDSTSNEPFQTFYDSNGESVMTTGVALKGNSNVKCVVLMDMPIQDIKNQTKDYAFFYIILMTVITVAIILLTILIVELSVVKPINKISNAAVQYVKDKQQGIKSKEHFEKLNIRTKDEIENLADVMSEMESDITSYEKDLKKVTKEKERISTELALANKIQASKLPNVFPAFPEIDEFDVYATMDPAKEVGGDFYDFYMIDEDHLGLVVADVSGKGVPAALFMMEAKIYISNYALMGFSPAKTLMMANQRMCENNDADLFVTVWFGVLELSTGKVVSANGGHDYPAVLRENGEFEIVEDKHGMVLGCMEEAKYYDTEIHLQKGEKMFLYTDGVPEAAKENREMLGIDGMLSFLNRCKTLQPKELVENMRKLVDEFVEGAEQFDDITMLAVVYNGEE